MTRALLIKMSSLGDVVHALPAVSDAAEHGVVFDWVVEEAFAPVAALHPGVHAVIPVAWRRWRRSLRHSAGEMRRFYARLREQHYDVILDSQGLIKSAVVSRLARGALRAGFARSVAREPASALFTDKPVDVPRSLHAIHRQRRLFAGVFGYELPDAMVYGIGRAQSSPGRSVLLLHGTTWASKHYPEALWVQLVERARADGFEVLVTHGNEAEAARASRLVGHGATMVPRLPLGDLLERLGSVALVIGVDSGLTHVAAALDRPVIGLYGPTDPTLTGVQGRRVRNLVSSLPCSPCRSASCMLAAPERQPVDPPCFGLLSPGRVWAEARSMLDAG